MLDVSAASLALAAYFLVRANRTASWEITCRKSFVSSLPAIYINSLQVNFRELSL